MTRAAVLLCLLAPPFVLAALSAAGAFTGLAQVLQMLPFAWLGGSLAFWLVLSVVFGVGPAPRPAARSWSMPSKLFHWVMALAVLAAVTLMYYIVNLGDTEDPAVRAEYGRLLKVHKSLGLVALFLVAFRYAWNRLRPRPPLPGALSAGQQRLARVSHGFLYLALLVVPLLGWMASMTYGGRTWFFGLFELPVWLPRNEAWALVLQPLHIYLAWAMLAFVGLHSATAFWHHVVRRDATLVQMLPRTPRSGSA
ncbi:MAG: cytochrome b [Chromatiales bacterium]|nr:cytochrome b [Chromatiales bacterium]